VRIGPNEQSHSKLCRAYDIHAASRRPARCVQGHPVQVQVWQACEQEQLRWRCSRGAHGFTCLFAGRERASLEARATQPSSALTLADRVLRRNSVSRKEGVDWPVPIIRKAEQPIKNAFLAASRWSAGKRS
jgi:hypothetical protein